MKCELCGVSDTYSALCDPCFGRLLAEGYNRHGNRTIAAEKRLEQTLHQQRGYVKRMFGDDHDVIIQCGSVHIIKGDSVK